MAESSTPTQEMMNLQQYLQDQAATQQQLVAQVQSLQRRLAAVQSVQAVQEPEVNAPSFAARKIKLDLPPKFAGKPCDLTGWIFQIEQYCGMVGLAKPTDMVRLAVSRLDGDAFTWWRQLASRGGYELGSLEWSDFKSEIVDAFVDVDRELKLRRKLASLRQ